MLIHYYIYKIKCCYLLQLRFYTFSVNTQDQELPTQNFFGFKIHPCSHSVLLFHFFHFTFFLIPFIRFKTKRKTYGQLRAPRYQQRLKSVSARSNNWKSGGEFPPNSVLRGLSKVFSFWPTSTTIAQESRILAVTIILLLSTISYCCYFLVRVLWNI